MRYIPRRLNVLADGLSIRNQVTGIEWSLHPGIVHQMFSIWYIPELDLFATRHNHELAVFVPPVPDPQAVAWDKQWVYAYPRLC